MNQILNYKLSIDSLWYHNYGQFAEIIPMFSSVTLHKPVIFAKQHILCVQHADIGLSWRKSSQPVSSFDLLQWFNSANKQLESSIGQPISTSGLPETEKSKLHHFSHNRKASLNTLKINKWQNHLLGHTHTHTSSLQERNQGEKWKKER